MSKYIKEFKKDAVRMSERESVSEVSAKPGAPTKALYTWRREEQWHT